MVKNPFTKKYQTFPPFFFWLIESYTLYSCYINTAVPKSFGFGNSLYPNMSLGPQRAFVHVVISFNICYIKNYLSIG